MLSTGFAKVDITPPVGCDLQGHFAKWISEAVRDPLYASALFIDDGSTQVCIVSCDVIGIEHATAVQVKDAVERAAGVCANHTVIATTHTHTGPTLIDFRPMGDQCEVTQPWLDELPARVADAVVQAKAAAAPSRFCCASGEALDIAHVRRYRRKDGSIASIPGPGDPTLAEPLAEADTELGVLAFGDSFDQLQSVLVNFSLHLDTVGGRNISADFPGVVRERLSDLGVVYTSGAMGNVNHHKAMAPPRWQGYFETAQRTGEILAAQTRDVIARMEAFTDDAPIRVANRAVALPLKSCPADQLAHWRVKARDPSADWVELIEQMGFLRAAHFGGETVDAHLTAIALGDVGLVTIPGELFVELGFYIKHHSPFAHTYIIELTDGYVGYIPTAEAADQGGYDAVTSPLVKGAGETLAQQAVSLLESIH